MDINLTKKGEVYENLKGNLIFVCCICNTDNVDFTEVESHLKTHIEMVVLEIDHNYNMQYEPNKIIHWDTNDKVAIRAEEPIDLLEYKDHTHYSDQSNNCGVSLVYRIPPKITKVAKVRKTNLQIQKGRQCDLCGRIFGDSLRLKAHLKRHSKEKGYKCDVCGHSFYDQTNMKVHLNRHSGIKPYSCTDCDKAFSTSTELKTHKTKHSGERNHICSVCSKTFSTSGRRLEHIRRAHTNERKHKCLHDKCGKAYFTPKQLEIHLRSHTGERPLNCYICDKTFADPKSLKNHIRLHDPEKRFQCRYCPIKFAQKSGRRGHEKRVHGAI